ncbi:hypothetical protein Y1Q_0005595 [Alligator mississippiensis]|uniref:Uncharacterized protein n=1 Tax=Alligator mississippiensis TaxID=8496 RepID=A0A151MF45_ALLMI|nr:hypothetical protein Y1Q_0005595 [Alligator mississippiensis]
MLHEAKYSCTTGEKLSSQQRRKKRIFVSLSSVEAFPRCRKECKIHGARDSTMHLIQTVHEEPSIVELTPGCQASDLRRIENADWLDVRE